MAPQLPAEMTEELENDTGRGGTKQRARELIGMGFEVPFKAAWPVFIEKTLPRFSDLTAGIFPSLARLPELCRSVLVS